MKTTFIPPETLANILDFEEKKETSTSQNSETSLYHSMFFDKKPLDNLAQSIFTKRLINNKICDTHDEYDIDEENFVLMTGSPDDDNNSYLEERHEDEENPKCQKIKDEIDFQIQDFKYKCIEVKCLSHIWCRILIFFLAVFVVGYSFYEFFIN